MWTDAACRSVGEELTVTDSHASDHGCDLLLVKDVEDHTVGLALVKSTSRSTGDDSAGILATVLKQVEAFAAVGSKSIINELSRATSYSRYCSHFSSSITSGVGEETSEDSALMRKTRARDTVSTGQVSLAAAAASGLQLSNH